MSNKFTAEILDIIASEQQTRKCARVNYILIPQGYEIYTTPLEILLKNYYKNKISLQQVFDTRDTYLAFLATLTLKEAVDCGILIKRIKR